MAYNGQSLSLVANNLEGPNSIFLYVTSDILSVVLGSNYFVGGFALGTQTRLKINDFIFAVCAGVPVILTISAVSDAGCTAVTVNSNGGSYPTTRPPDGSGIVWNNGNYLCVA